MKNIVRTLFIISLIILFAMIAGFVWIVRGFGGFSPSQEAIQAQAIRENNPSLCNKLPLFIPDTKPRANCYYNVAIATKNTKICYDQPNTSGSLAYDTCLIGIAAKYKDVSICDEMRDFGAEKLGFKFIYPTDRQLYDTYVRQCYQAVEWALN